MRSAVTKTAYYFFSGVFLFLLVLVWFSPYQIINSDSVTGFEALKGWETSGKFNCTIQPNPSNIAVFNTSFLAWWTPGQYLFPYFLQRLFYISLGHAITVLNFLSVFIGLIGFYKLFAFYRFPEKVIALSLLLILFSNTVLFRFISYQGGETLSFLFFPWLVYFYIKAKSKIGKAILAMFFLLLGFIAKSQLLIALIPLFYLIPLSAYPINVKAPLQILKKLAADFSYLTIALLISLLIIYFFFLSKGMTPAEVSHFNPSLPDTFIPLASPVTAIGNIWSVVSKIGEKHPAIQVILLIISTAFILLIFFKSGLNDKYNRFVFLYYIIICLAFIVLYYFDSRVDYDVRHLKFLGYLFFPILTGLLLRFLSYQKVTVLVTLVSLLSLVNHFRLGKAWFKDTYVSQGDFRLTMNEFPRELYKVLIQKQQPTPVFFFSPFESRWAVDHKNFICWDSRINNTYFGKGYPIYYVEKESAGWENELKNKFPAYNISSCQKIGDYLLVQLN